MRTPVEGRRDWSGAGVGALILVALLAIGLALPRFFITDGLERFGADPARRAVAARAYHGAWTLDRSRIARFFLPVARVEEVGFEPGHCAAGEPGADQEHSPFTARVRFYTVFALPGPTVRATCGGWSWRPRGSER